MNERVVRLADYRRPAPTAEDRRVEQRCEWNALGHDMSPRELAEALAIVEAWRSVRARA